MKKILSNIRKKSPGFRAVLSLILAFVFTVAIVVGYIAIRSSDSTQESSAPGPISSFVQSVKSATSGNTSQNVQVIDASQTGESNPKQVSSPDGTTNSFDESNPFGLQVQPQNQTSN